VLTALPDESLDVIVCSAVLEHLWDPEACIAQLHRVLAPGGVLLVAVPSWLGKTVLEFLAFKLKLSADEMDDHKRYFDPRDLWPMLVDAGFRPRLVRCRRHWMRMNTFAVCRREDSISSG
jgi:SAM-dependent methyltransferase